MKPPFRRVSPGNAQDKGDRDTQEDAFGFSSLDDADFTRHAGVAAVLCDGMGGLEHGADAATIAVSTFLGEYRRKLPEEPIPQALIRCSQRANDEVYKFAQRTGSVNRSGCTLVAVVVRGVELHCIHAGDSRAYVHNGQELEALTRDHSYAQVLERMARQGQMSADEVQEHPRRDHLTSHLGRLEIPELDVMEPPRRLLPNDWILLCSDGLHGVLNDDEIAAELKGASQDAARRLIDRVLARAVPEQDNVTVLLFHVQPDGRVEHSHQQTGRRHTLSPSARNPGQEVTDVSSRVVTARKFGWRAWGLATVPLWIAAGIWAWPPRTQENTPASLTAIKQAQPKDSQGETSAVVETRPGVATVVTPPRPASPPPLVAGPALQPGKADRQKSKEAGKSLAKSSKVEKDAIKPSTERGTPGSGAPPGAADKPVEPTKPEGAKPDANRANGSSRSEPARAEPPKADFAKPPQPPVEAAKPPTTSPGPVNADPGKPQAGPAKPLPPTERSEGGGPP